MSEKKEVKNNPFRFRIDITGAGQVIDYTVFALDGVSALTAIKERLDLTIKAGDINAVCERMIQRAGEIRYVPEVEEG